MSFFILIKKFLIHVCRFLITVFKKKKNNQDKSIPYHTNPKLNQYKTTSQKTTITRPKSNSSVSFNKKSSLGFHSYPKNNLLLYQYRYEPHLLINGLSCLHEAHPIPIVKYWQDTQKSITIIKPGVIQLKKR